MTTPRPPVTGLNHSANQWSRALGVTLRPWSGSSPLRLIISAVIQFAICVLFLWLALRMMTSDELAASGIETPALKTLTIVMAVAAVLLGLFSIVRLVVGVIDLTSSREVAGTVMSLRERQPLDILPRPLALAILTRGGRRSQPDSYRYRTEVVVDTGSGVRQWTIDNRRRAVGVRPGVRVRMKVTPIAGHVSRLTVLLH